MKLSAEKFSLFVIVFVSILSTISSVIAQERGETPFLGTQEAIFGSATTPARVQRFPLIPTTRTQLISSQSSQNASNNIRLAQAAVPKVASSETAAPRVGRYQGAGTILRGENITTTDPQSSSQALPMPQRLPSPSVVQQLTSPPTLSTPPSSTQQMTTNLTTSNHYLSDNDITWDGHPPIDEGSEVLPDNLGDFSTSGIPSQYFSDPMYGGVDSGMYLGYPNARMYNYNNIGMSGYDEMYGGMTYGYPGMYANGYYCPGIFSLMFNQIYCSNLMENLSFGIGGTAFQSPLDLGNGSNFGITETINWSTPSTSAMPISTQIGFRAIQADLQGYQQGNRWNDSNRDQYFGTFGLFRRNLFCCPLNFGVAYDVMKDNYYQNYKTEQIRSELSYGTPFGFEFGYRGAVGTKNDIMQHPWFVNRTIKIEPIDYHLLFLRKYYGNGGEGSLAAGATEYGDPMFQANFNIPLTNCVELKNSLTYIVPKDDNAFPSRKKETWDLTFQLIYQPRGGVLAGFYNPFRPMFDVAGNGSMIQKHSSW